MKMELVDEKFLLEFAAYYATPLLRGKLYLVIDTAEEKEFEIAILVILEHVSSEIHENRNLQKKELLTKTYKCYKASIFLWNNELAKSLFWHETDFCWVFLSKVWILELYLESSRSSLMGFFAK